MTIECDRWKRLHQAPYGIYEQIGTLDVYKSTSSKQSKGQKKHGN